MTPELLFKLHLSLALVLFLSGLAIVLLRAAIFENLVGSGLCMKLVFFVAFVVARYRSDMQNIMSALAFSTLAMFALSAIVGLALGLRGYKSQPILQTEEESQLKH